MPLDLGLADIKVGVVVKDFVAFDLEASHNAITAKTIMVRRHICFVWGWWLVVVLREWIRKKKQDGSS
jgi:hypothetical protein